MNARTNSKKSLKTQKVKEKKLCNKKTAPEEENVINFHASEEDRSIVTDIIEENHPIIDPKPNNTSTPKRKAIIDQGPPNKKLILEENQTNIDAAKDEIEVIEEITSKENTEAKTHSNIEFQKTMEAMMVQLTKRLDTLEKSKQKEDEEKILSNTTRDLQDSALKNAKKANDDTEDSSSDSSSDEEENEALEASRQECTELREEVEKQKRNNELACHMLERWETEKTKLTQALKDKEKDYTRACDDNDTNLQEIKRLKKTADQSLKLTEEKVIGYEKRIKDLEGELDAKSEKLKEADRFNTRMITKNSELEKNNKRLKAAVRKLEEEAQRDYLKRKQLFETPRAEIPYFEDFENRDKKKSYTCNRNCIVGGKKWLEFERKYGIDLTSYETGLKHVNEHVLEHWVKFQALKELIRSNRNQSERKDWEEIVLEYNSIGELGNHGFDLTEISIMNTSQVEKTRMGIKENDWVIDTVCNMYDKVMLAAIQICGLKDPDTKTNVDHRDGEEIMKIWDDGRKLLMKGKEVIPGNMSRMSIPGCSIYRRKHQKTDGTDLTIAHQRAERDESEK